MLFVLFQTVQLARVSKSQGSLMGYIQPPIRQGRDYWGIMPAGACMSRLYTMDRSTGAIINPNVICPLGIQCWSEFQNVRDLWWDITQRRDYKVNASRCMQGQIWHSGQVNQWVLARVSKYQCPFIIWYEFWPFCGIMQLEHLRFSELLLSLFPPPPQLQVDFYLQHESALLI